MSEILPTAPVLEMLLWAVGFMVVFGAYALWRDRPDKPPRLPPAE